MPEELAFALLALVWAMAAYIAYLNFWVIRRLRKKLDRITDAALSGQSPIATRPAAVPIEQGELSRIQDRLRVLERIAVEKEDTLSREIEELRAVGR